MRIRREILKRFKNKIPRKQNDKLTQIVFRNFNIEIAVTFNFLHIHLEKYTCKDANVCFKLQTLLKLNSLPF